MRDRQHRHLPAQPALPRRAGRRSEDEKLRARARRWSRRATAPASSTPRRSRPPRRCTRRCATPASRVGAATTAAAAPPSATTRQDAFMGGAGARDGRDQRLRPGHRQGRHPLRRPLPDAGRARGLLPGSRAAPAATAKSADCTLLFLHSDKAVQQFFLAGRYPAQGRRRRPLRRAAARAAAGGAAWTLEALAGGARPAEGQAAGGACACCATRASSPRDATAG